MNFLILSCSTGEGHNAAARAVQEELTRQGHEAVLQDMMLLAGPHVARAVGGGYVGTVQHAPRLFSALYDAGSHLSSTRRRSPVYYANALVAGRLERLLARGRFDGVVTTHLFCAETLTWLKRHGRLHVPCLAVATDYTCIPFWEETDCDRYVIPHPELTDEFAGRGIPRSRLLAFGIPVSARFSQPMDPAAARARCGLPPDSRVYLVMGGSMGFGQIRQLTDRLAEACLPGEQVVVLCGRNDKLKAAIERRHPAGGPVTAVGYTRRVADYMAGCAVIYTKPGGLTSTEAAVRRIPIVHTSCIPGCETRNLAFFAGHGLSMAARKLPEQVSCGLQLVRDELSAEAMRRAQAEHISPCAASRLVEALVQLCSSRKEE